MTVSIHFIPLYHLTLAFFHSYRCKHPSLQLDTMSIVSRTARFLLIGHGLLNIAQGFYSITRPYDWTVLAGSSFVGTPPAAVQSIGIFSLPRLFTQDLL